jgi:integrase
LIEVPRHRAREIQPLTDEQARALLDEVKGDRLEALVSVALALGLRIGEALGLVWQHIDLKRGTVTIAQALERSGGDAVVRKRLNVQRRDLLKQFSEAPDQETRRQLMERLKTVRAELKPVRQTLHFNEPKSQRSKRTIVMPEIVASALKQHRTRQLKERLAAGPDWQDSKLVFTTPIGTPLDPRNVHREFKTLLVDAGLPLVRFHDLRHTAATLLLAQGVDPRTIMETLGHSQISLTLNTYSHVVPALQRAAAAKMDAVLKG